MFLEVTSIFQIVYYYMAKFCLALGDAGRYGQSNTLTSECKFMYVREESCVKK